MRSILAVALALAVATTLVVPSPAKADVTITDAYADAIAISSTSFSASWDASGHTTETDEPAQCGAIHQTAWFTITPTEDGVLTAQAFNWPVYSSLNIYEVAGPAITDLVPVDCANWNAQVSARLVGGTTYAIQVGLLEATTDAWTQLSVRFVEPPANDDFADAHVIGSLPYLAELDGTAATTESGEPGPSCEFFAQSTWYRFTATESRTMLIQPYYPSTIAVFTGSGFGDLTEIACRPWYYGGGAFAAVAGTTYYLQVTSFQLHALSIDVAPPPSVDIWFWPWDPSTFDTVQFSPGVSDPAGMAVQSYAWDFGDGTGSSDPSPTHRYSANGDYLVTLRVAMDDGRVGERSQLVSVRTRDVAITKFNVPKAASAGQSRTIVVGLVNRVAPELVRVTLYRSTPYGEAFVGVTELTLPVRGSNRTTDVSFTYVFSPDDAAVGKVTFRAVVETLAGRDALPSDNEAIATTKVTR